MPDNLLLPNSKPNNVSLSNTFSTCFPSHPLELGACRWRDLEMAGVQRDKGKGTSLVNSQLTSCTHAQHTLCQSREFKTLGSLRNHHVKRKRKRRRSSQANECKCLNLGTGSHIEAPGNPVGKAANFLKLSFGQVHNPLWFFYSSQRTSVLILSRILQKAQLLPEAALALAF